MSELLLERTEGVATITINRPEALNAMRSDMWPALLELLREVEHDREIRCVVLRGAGENFCAGGDVKQFHSTVHLSSEERAEFWMRSADETNQMFLALERIPQPVVASVRGAAAGGGLALVAQADLAVASETARFLVAQIKLGAIPDSGASYNILRHMGVKRTKQLCFLGDTFDAHEALEIGLVNWVVPDHALDEKTMEIAARIAKMPPVAIARTKAAINKAHRIGLAEHFVQESLDVGACVSEEDFAQRVRGFLERSSRK